MTLKTIPIEDNRVIDSIVVGDDGTVAIGYKVATACVFRSGGEDLTVKPIIIGPTLQIVPIHIPQLGR